MQSCLVKQTVRMSYLDSSILKRVGEIVQLYTCLTNGSNIPSKMFQLTFGAEMSRSTRTTKDAIIFQRNSF